MYFHQRKFLSGVREIPFSLFLNQEVNDLGTQYVVFEMLPS